MTAQPQVDESDANQAPKRSKASLQPRAQATKNTDRNVPGTPERPKSRRLRAGTREIIPNFPTSRNGCPRAGNGQTGPLEYPTATGGTTGGDTYQHSRPTRR